MAGFGHFSEDGKEYVINSPLLPARHLINFGWNSSFISGVNQFGTGEGVFNNQTLLYNNPIGRCRMVREGKRYFYIRDSECEHYWNIGYFPVKHQPFTLNTVFGTGYSKFIHETEGIRTEALCLVAYDEPVEIWKIIITNVSGRKRKLKVYPYVEWLLQGYEMKSDYYAYLFSQYHEDIHAVVSCNTAEERPHERYNGLLASNIKPSGYTGSVREFMGVYGEPSRPQNVVTGVCSNKPTSNENLAGSLEIKVELDMTEQKELIFIIGNTSDIHETKRLVKKVLNEEYIAESFKRTKERRENLYSNTIISTPDQKINHLINIWSKVQIQLCAEFGRDGVRGFRDTLQDACAIALFNPALGKEKMMEALRYQLQDGWALRGWMPVTPKHYSDSTTWIMPAFAEYIKYTGETGVLKEIVPYYDGGEGTVLEHILKALRFLNRDKGKHGLCLAHMGDWNDSLNWMGKDGTGESVMTSMAHYKSLNLFIELAQTLLFNQSIIEEMQKAAVEIRDAIENSTWDGEWYIQGYSDAGNKVGSRENEQGKIYLVPQAWAVLSGVSKGSRAVQCIKSSENMLESNTGSVMCWPAFTKRDENVGRLTIMTPGMYENASTYCHGSAFMIAAELLLKRANEAYDLFKKIIPDSDTHPSDISGVEPYAFTNQYLGPDNPRAGVSVSGWITGTSGWIYRNVINLFFGFQPRYNGLIIDPCIPDEWKEVSMSTELRGTRYNIKIINEAAGKKKIVVNGKAIEGKFISYTYDEIVDVVVMM